MSRSGALGFGSLFILTALLIAGYVYEDSASAAETTLTEKEPLSITIESESTGISAEKEVKIVYEARKERLSENLTKILKEEKDPEKIKSLNYTLDSITCMDESIRQYPKLMEVIHGENKNAQEIYKEMEGNCVEDVLFYLKRNHPDRFLIVNKAFVEAGFVTPEIKD